MRALAALVSGRRTKWLVPVVWLVLIAVFTPLGSKLADETKDETSTFLPKSAESTEVNNLLKERFASGQTVNGIIVYRRATGLTAADKRRIISDARRAQAELPLVGKPAVPFTPARRRLVSPDGRLAYTVLTFRDNYDKLGDWGKKVRDITGDGGGGLEVWVTGDAGFAADFEEVFGSLDTTLLLATVLLVLILLGAIYRSPLIAIIPLVVVFAAYSVAQGLIYLYAKSGATVSSNSTQILVVLMFGLGTDYCMLLLSRYREELQRQEDKHEAMACAVRRSGPAIFASGLTVALSMLVLLVADTRSISSLGPVAAIGVLCVLGAGLTLLPALLTIGGRRAFWPRRRSVEYVPGAEAHVHRGVWRRLGDRVMRRPGLALAVTALIFGGGALGLLAYKENYSITNAFKKQVESVQGFRALEKAFPAGTSNPTTVLVERTDGPVRPSDVEAVRRRLESVPQIANVGPVIERSRDGHIARIDLVFRNDPYTDRALNSVPKIRDRLKDLPPGVTALLGSGTAVQYDFAHATRSDTRKIVPLALLVIAMILGLLLQSLVAPVVIILTVLASFFGTLGISLLFFRYVVGDAGVDSSLPVFAFIFLVALGVDYTIFLMSRVREEARTHGTREGVLRALAATGPVITSAGLVLAGTFSVLMTLPVTFAFNIGFMVAVGILLDTFVVRTIMLPAAVELIGDRIWWPSDPSGGLRALRAEEAGGTAEPAAAGAIGS
jgi:putative drug exporter of the RND superfamily